jgi:acyl-CoA synthetase (AMP-forming)/AMP-acid ligase II
MAAMNAQPPSPGTDLSSLEHTLIGAAPLSNTILAAFLNNVSPRAHPNLAVRQVYGLTETCKVLFICSALLTSESCVPQRFGLLHWCFGKAG